MTTEVALTKQLDTVETSALMYDNGTETHHAPQIQEPVIPTIFQRLDRLRIAIVVLGTLLNLGALAFLWFLWTANDKNDLWRRIVVVNWIPRTITLIALLLRFVTTAQATICTSILATMVLHKYGVLLPDLASVSMMQFQNSGPHALLGPIMSSLRRGRSFWISVPLMALLAATLLLQFSSTILLSDVTLAPVLGNIEQSMVRYGFNFSDDRNSDYFLETGYWQRKPNVFPAFAEDSDTSIEASQSHDTGRAIRAFLPVFPEARRNLLSSYHGPALVFDARVVCMQPTLEDFSYSWDSDSYAPPAPRITGRVGTEAHVDGFQVGDPNNPLSPFDCASTIQGPLTDDAEWPLVMCVVNQSSGIVSPLTRNGRTIQEYMQYAVEAFAFLVINTTGTYSRWGTYYQGSETFLGNNESVGHADSLEFAEPLNYQHEGEWLHVPSNDPSITMSFSLCFASFATADTVVDATSGHNRTEAVLGWDKVGNKFDTLAVRQHLGAELNPKPLEERGVLKLNVTNHAEGVDDPGVYGPTTPVFIISSTTPNTYFGDRLDFAINMCLRCDSAHNTSRHATAHAALSAIFNHVAQETRHPALALQAVWTTIFGMTYYDHAEEFDYFGDMSTASFIFALAPTSMKALSIVTAFLVIHLILLLSTVLCFALSRKPGIIGNSWNIHGQMQGEKMQIYTRNYGWLSDREVESAMKEDGLGQVWVGLGARHRGGRALLEPED